MSQISVGHSGHGHDAGHGGEAHIAARGRIDPALLTMPHGAGRALSAIFLLVGLVAVVATFFLGYGGRAAQAMAAYHMGFLFTLGLALGCLGITMMLQQFNSGWSGPVCRQAENISSNIWVVGLLFLPIVVLEVFLSHGHPRLFHWMSPDLLDQNSAHYDTLLNAKKGFLNTNFWLVRYVFYFVMWMWFATKLAGWSRAQDRTGDKWLTAKARKISSVGLLLFALSCAFASFDYVMSLDHHWYSTMFGVWFFSAAAKAAFALIIVILASLKLRGKLGAAYTSEHLHDTGKLLFAFTVFWAYISFSQYFLMWYSNIPEETAYFNLRVREAWQPFPMIMVVANFVVPFLLLLVRNFKRNPTILRLIALWVLVAFALDLYFLVRPILRGVEPGEGVWLDALGILGPVCIFLAVVVRTVCKHPLTLLKDPRLHEVLAHKNYV
ncbi:MAG: hypothetical protein IT438_01035 [Phycisphaerales bacterium]|nr:hypothetical protein [Phycisphaerales bacterium]